jgi:hypothetical protein
VSPRWAAGTLAGLLLAVGLLVGLLPVHVGAASVSCGSAISGDSAAISAAELADFRGQIHSALTGADTEATSYADQCAEARSSRATVAWVLAGVGVVAALGAAVVVPSRRATV